MTTATAPRWEDIYRIKQRHTGHWFSPDTLRFFRSRVAQGGYVTPDGARVYFVSSEQFDYNSPRLYTVRVQDRQTGAIDTLGEFQQYGSRNTADRAAQKAAAE
jgi:hypothetical protein